MKIAIHHRSGSFSSYWINYCERNKIDYVLVNSFSKNIIEELRGCDAFLYNWLFWHSSDVLLAKQLVYSVEQMGIEVYPNIKTCFYYDDKLGQKYLSESLDLPVVNSHTFFYKEDALKWIENVRFPIVFKLRGGASSVNVKLVRTKNYAKKLINKSFSNGFRSKNIFANIQDRISVLKKNQDMKAFVHVLKGFIRILYPDKHDRMRYREKGYIYFQDYIPNCTHDVRVVVVGNRAFAMNRYNRKDDFRASGSGIKVFSPDAINIGSIKLAFELNKKLKMQSVAFDFLEDDNKIWLVEYSYTWAIDSFGKFPGYWDCDLNWHEGSFCPADFIIEDVIANVKCK